jgi:Kelch motif/Putative Ig domain
MNHVPPNSIRLWVLLSVSAGFLAANITVNAQAPEIIGEPDLNVLRTNEAFDPVSNTWLKKTPMPTKRWNIDTAVVQGKIYAIGGSCCTVSCDPLDTVEIYDPANNSWVTGTPLPFPPLGNGAAGAANGIIYFVGGQTGCGGEVSTNEAFDPATNMWSTKAPMHTARYQFGIAAVFDSNLGHEVLYAIGGGVDGVGAIDTVERYDPGTDAWTTKAHMPTPRYGLQVAAVNGKIYAIGGVGGSGVDCTTGDCHTVEEYDPATDTWTTKAPMPTTRGGSGTAAGVVNGIIYVAGGSNDNRQLSTVEAYNPVTDTWSTVPPMPTARDSLGGAVINNKFYAIGGILSGGAATVGRPFVYQVTATNHPTSYDAGLNLLSGPCSGLPLPPGNASDLPPGLAIDHTTGLIFGLPTEHGYDAVVPISATNAYGTGCSYITLSVQDAPPFFSPAVSTPMIVSSTSVTGRTNRPFRFQILNKDPPKAGLTRFTAGGLPPGLTIDNLSGVISGTPTSDGNFLVSVSVSEGPAIATGILQITFISDPTIPIVTSSSDALLTPGTFFTRTLTSDPPGQFTYIGTDGLKHGPSATCGGLPPGLCFDGMNTISGTYNPTPTPTPRAEFTSVARDFSTTAPDTIKIRPAFAIDPTATNPAGTGVAPLNFFATGPPIVTTNPATLIASFSATLNGSLNPDGLTTSVHFQYGTTTNYGFTTANQSFTGTTDRNVSANISGLTAHTTYHFRIVATNGAGTTYGSDRTFTTLNATGPPVVTTNPAALVASFSAALEGSVDPHGLTTSIYFRYGTTNSYGLTTAPQNRSGNRYQNISANISSLSANTTYHFRIVATNSAGTRFGSDRTFTTLSATGPPVVTTNPVTNLTSSSATLNGLLDPHGLATTVFFRWGTTTSYGHTTTMQSESGNAYRNIAASITGLSTHTTYHFRIVATNSAGTRFGSDRTFTTP